MTATDELRRLLDERGVEYKRDDEQLQTVFRSVYGGKCAVVEWHDDFDAHLFHLTSEQAVEATLGRGTCINVGWRIDLDEFECSECGYDGWTKWAIDHRDRVPNYCPNCGRRVVDA